MSRAKFVGEAGEHYVAYKLSREKLCVGITIGNMPHIDLLVSSKDGLKSMSIQVKTSNSAYRRKRYGREGFEWDVGGSVIGRHSDDFWYCLVDLKGDETQTPDVFIVPSFWVSQFVLPTFTRKLYFLPVEAAEITKNRWDMIHSVLNNETEKLGWAKSWNEKILVRWGGPTVE